MQHRLNNHVFKHVISRYSLLILWLFLPAFSSCIESRKVETKTRFVDHKLGSTPVRLRIINNNKASYVYVILHDNETTAEETVMKMISEKGGNFVKIENSKQRNMQFKVGNREYLFDPNRMFTQQGRVTNLQKNRNYSQESEKEIEKFAELFLRQVEIFQYIIALHNNTNGNYSINDYKNNLSRDASEIHVNPLMDLDNFILTTDKDLFKKLKDRNINVVLQNNSSATDDGSLSVYAGREKLKYVNIETEHGQLAEQERLVKEILEIIK